tara:strand:+ start:329 stop:670 length:342 start_codon:yes stop_codon:yes gene_type:complete
MSFLKSPQVRAGLVEINELQQKIMKDAMKFPHLNLDDQYEHIEDLEDLLEKQRLMYTRISLSDDPEAKEMKKNILGSIDLMGLKQPQDPDTLFKMMQQTISQLRKMVEQRLDK